MASDGTERGIFERCLAFCLERSGNLRIDTHADNRIMQRLIEKSGFVRCGIIHLADESADVYKRQVPYLSNKWFDLIRYACEKAKEYGLEAWLYDEYPYPSGMSGGEVLLEHPDAGHKILNHKTVSAKGGEEVVLDLGWSEIIYLKAVKIREDGSEEWDSLIDLTGDPVSYTHLDVYKRQF